MSGREIHAKDFDEKRLSAVMAGKTSKDGQHSFQSGEVMYNLNPDTAALPANAVINIVYGRARCAQGIHLIKASKDSAKAKEFKNDKPSDPVVDMEFVEEADEKDAMKIAYGIYGLMRRAGGTNSTVMAKWDPKSGITADQFLGTKIKRPWYQPTDPLGNPVTGSKPRISAKVTKFTQFMLADNTIIPHEKLAGMGFEGIGRVKPHHITFVNEISLIAYLTSFTIIDIFEAEVQGIPVALNAVIATKYQGSAEAASKSMAAIMEARRNKGLDMPSESKALVLVGAAGPGSTSQTAGSGTQVGLYTGGAGQTQRGPTGPAGITAGATSALATADQVAAAIRAAAGQTSAIGSDGLLGAPSGVSTQSGAPASASGGAGQVVSGQLPPQYTATGSSGFMGQQPQFSSFPTSYGAPPQYSSFQGTGHPGAFGAGGSGAGTGAPTQLPMTMQPAFGGQPQIIHSAGMQSFAAAMGQHST